MPLAGTLNALRQFVLEYAKHRRSEGRAEFNDLLIWARDLVRDNLEVRDYFRHRFTHILVDESQDTDPIQAEIAMLLAEDSAEGVPECNRALAWDQVKPAPGKVFVVGDPKQSIYRFSAGRRNPGVPPPGAAPFRRWENPESHPEFPFPPI